MKNNILNRALLTLSIIIILIWSLPYLFLPNISMDESYYIGAALKFINNDFFLTSYKFDKPFLISWLLSPGIVIFGENYLGFRIPGLLFTLGCIFYFYKILKQINHKYVFFMPFLSLLFVTTFFIEHTISAYTEPFLLFFLLGMLHHSLNFFNTENEFELRKSYLYFFLATFTKFSSIMWGPILFFTYLSKRKNPYKLSSIKDELKLFFYSGSLILIPGCIYFLTNKKKLSPITWLFSNLFVNNGDTNSTKITLLYRSEFWIDALAKTLGTSSVIITILSILLSLYFIFKKRSEDVTKFGLLFFTPMLMHYFGLIISGAPLFSRYYFIFIPQIILMILILPVHSVLKDRYSIPLKIIVLCALILPNLAPLFPTVKSTSSRIYSLISEELLDENFILHNKDNVWESRPFLNHKYLQFYCFDEACQNEAQIGRLDTSNQFLLTRAENNEPSLIKILTNKKYITKKLTIKNVDNQITKFLTGLRLRKSKYDISYKIQESSSYDLTNSFHEYDGLPIQINILSKKSNKGLVKKILGERTHININGKLVISHGRRVNEHWGNISALGIRIESLSLFNIDYNFVDLVPIILKSYYIPFLPVNILTKNYDILNINAKNNEINLEIAEYQTNI